MCIRDSPNGAYAKVNPPIRPREDVEYLWSALLDGKIDWVVSDHACCAKEIKTDKDDPEDIFLAKSGFGGTEYLLSGLYSEGVKRGLSLNNIAKLVCLNPAQRYGLKSKGDIQEGFDADLVIFDIKNPWSCFIDCCLLYKPSPQHFRCILTTQISCFISPQLYKKSTTKGGRPAKK